MAQYLEADDAARVGITRDELHYILRLIGRTDLIPLLQRGGVLHLEADQEGVEPSDNWVPADAP